MLAFQFARVLEKPVVGGNARGTFRKRLHFAGKLLQHLDGQLHLARVFSNRFVEDL